MWSLVIDRTKDVKLRALHWKILNNIHPTNIFFIKMGISDSYLCKHCKGQDYIEHFSYGYALVKPLWHEIENRVSTFYGKRIRLEPKYVFLGLTQYDYLEQKSFDTVNRAIIVAKMSICKVKFGKGEHI